MTRSAGIVLYRISDGELRIFLVHPGGPFWKNKDIGSWSIPKGLISIDEVPLAAAIREFKEETGKLLSGNFVALTHVKMKSGKLIYAWALEGDIDPNTVTSNTFEMEWPPKSGKLHQFPEIDRGQWFTFIQACEKVSSAQVALLDQLNVLLNPKIKPQL